MYFENRDPLKGDGNMTSQSKARSITSMSALKTETRLKGMETYRAPQMGHVKGSFTALKTETRLKGMETHRDPGHTANLALAPFENRDPLKGDGNYTRRRNRSNPNARL